MSFWEVQVIERGDDLLPRNTQSVSPHYFFHGERQMGHNNTNKQDMFIIIIIVY